MKRRTFLQLAAAAIACGQAVWAAPSLGVSLKARLEGNAIWADLTFHNSGSEPVDVLLRSGNRSAVEVEGRLQEWVLTAPPEPSSEPMTRAGPRLEWRPVPAHGELHAGSYRLPLPEDARRALPGVATFTVGVETNRGALRIPAGEVSLPEAE